jgi:hypothetical protein
MLVYDTGIDAHKQNRLQLVFRLADKTFQIQKVSVIIGLPGRHTFLQTEVRCLTSQRLVHKLVLSVHGGENGLANFLADRP